MGILNRLRGSGKKNQTYPSRTVVVVITDNIEIFGVFSSFPKAHAAISTANLQALGIKYKMRMYDVDFRPSNPITKYWRPSGDEEETIITEG